MSFKNLIPILIMLVIVSCNQNKRPLNTALRDSVAKNYFLNRDTAPYYNLDEEDYKLFKAYYKNDTAFLKSYQREALQEIELVKEAKAQSHPVLTVPRIQSVDADKVYQLFYGNTEKSICIIITIWNKTDSANLSYELYQSKEPHTLAVTKAESRKIPLKEWQEFEDIVRHCEFWDLKPKKDNGCGFYTEFLNVKWFEKQGNNIHFISRVNPQQWSIFIPFKFLLDRCGLSPFFDKNLKAGRQIL